MPATRRPTAPATPAEPEPLPAPTLAAFAEFRAALSRFSDATRRCLAEEDITPRQFALLAVLSQAPDGTLTVSAVAAALNLNHNSTVELTQRAERAGLIHRVPDADDARRVLIRLSDHGARQLHRLARAHITGLRAEREQLITSLQRWAHHLEAIPDEP